MPKHLGSKTDLVELVQERLANLRSRSFPELALLPPHSQEVVRRRRRKVVVSTWREDLEDKAIQVVVQAYRPLLLGFGFMAADGFILSSAGDARPLPEDTLWQFT